MSFKHIIVSVDYYLDDIVNDMADRMRERGQTCDVDIRKVGIHHKFNDAEKDDYDYILVVSRLQSEIDSFVVRENKTKMKINEKQMKLVDFMHHIWLNS